MVFVIHQLEHVLVTQITHPQIVLNCYYYVQITVQEMVFVIHQLEHVIVIKIILDLIVLN